VTGVRFRLNTEFPTEGFVQGCVERYFAEHGYECIGLGTADYAGVHPTSGERWIVEAKGETAAVGLDFRTALGQLLQTMDEASARYGVAVPLTPKFLRQLRRVPDRVRTALHLHWLIVDETGGVTMIAPHEGAPTLGA
jgi:hypothetical protein